MNEQLVKLNAQILLDPSGRGIASYLVSAHVLDRLLDEKKAANQTVLQLFALFGRIAIRHQLTSEDLNNLIAIGMEAKRYGIDLDLSLFEREYSRSGESALQHYLKGSTPNASQRDKESVEPPPPPEVANWVIEPVPPEVREHFLRTFDEAEYLAEIRELERTGGVQIDDLIADREERANGSA